MAQAWGLTLRRAELHLAALIFIELFSKALILLLLLLRGTQEPLKKSMGGKFK